MNDELGQPIAVGDVVMFITTAYRGAYYQVGVVERMTEKRVRVLAAPLPARKEKWVPKATNKTPGKLLVVTGATGITGHAVTKKLLELLKESEDG